MTDNMTAEARANRSLRALDYQTRNQRHVKPPVNWAAKVPAGPSALKLPESPWSEVGKLVDKHDELRTLYAQTRLELIAAHEATDGAKDQDEAAYALALRNGSGDPGTTQADANAATIAGLERKLSALKTAMLGVTQDVAQLKADKHAEWSAQIEADYTSAVDVMFESFGAWVAASPVDTVTKVAQLATLHDWVHDSDYANRAQSFSDLAKLAGDARGVVAEVEADRTETIVTKGRPTAEEVEAEQRRRQADHNGATLEAAFSRSKPKRHGRPSELAYGNALRSGTAGVTSEPPTFDVARTRPVVSPEEILARKLEAEGAPAE